MTGVRDELRGRNRRGERIRLWDSEIVRVATPTPSTVRVTLGGEDLAGFGDGELPADAIKLALPAAPGESPRFRMTPQGPVPEGPRPAFRPYTVRRSDSGARTLDLDVVLHGDGPGVRWARTARAGQRVQFFGPRSEFWACPDVDAHVLVGDATAVPGALAVLESLPGAEAVALLQVDGAAEESSDDPRIHWQHGGDLLSGLSGTALPRGRVQAWVAGEAGLVRDVRRHLLGERGVDRADLQATGYWRLGMTVTETDAARLAAVAEAERSGTPVPDHHDVDLADLEPAR
ncbi:MAG: hypothetical protein ABS81_22565 [Pseudonocardia sp. SCN 72-86]|nr:MAG: hypothetical protein ABS81_22565 [Pseudonocardia sp. SCN 72-86]